MDQDESTPRTFRGTKRLRSGAPREIPPPEKKPPIWKRTQRCPHCHHYGVWHEVNREKEPGYMTKLLVTYNCHLCRYREVRRETTGGS